MQKKIIDVLVIAAMSEEMDEITARLKATEIEQHDGFIAMRGLVDDVSVLVVRSGVGKINAAITTTYFLMRYHPRAVINVGSAGGLHEAQHVEDIVVSTKVLSHDLDIGPSTATDLRFQYEADAHLISSVNAVLKQLNQRHMSGLVVSGDQFVVNDSYAYNRIKTLYPEAICVEMEACAVAAACVRFKVPFIVIRALSDVPYYKNNDETFEQYLVHASKKSAQICIETIKKARI